MDTKVVEVRKNKLIQGALVNENKIEQTINIDFIPDEVIIRSILYTTTDGKDTEGASVYTDLVSDYIGSFIQNVSMTQNIQFTLKKPINGQYTFKFFGADNSTKEITGYIFIHLDFVKYKEVKEQKVL